MTEQFFPAADRDQVQIELELPSSASLRDTLATASRVREAVISRSEVDDVHWFLGESAPTFYYNVVMRRKNTSHYAQALVQLKSAEGARALIHQLQDQLDRQFPDARILVRQLEQGPPFDAPIEVRLFGPDIQRLRELGEQVRTVLVKTKDVIHTRSELSEALPKLALSIDEEQARLAGLDHESIAGQLDAILEGAVGGSVLESTEELPVRVRLPNSQRADLDRIASLDLLPSQARSLASHPGIPLSALADVNLVPELAAIARLDGQRMNEVQAFIPAGVLPADVLSRFQDRWEASGFELPPGYTVKFGGEAAKRNEAVGNLLANVGVLLVLMVATLVLSFGSFRIAGVIGAVAALAAGLGLGALWVFGYPFGFMAIVGTMGLIGVAINDAIVVMAALREDERARAGHPSAVREVVVRSTRHVVSTSLTTMAGFAPLVIAGGGFWPPLAVTIAGGVGGATILALYFVPSAYILAMCPGGCAERAKETEPRIVASTPLRGPALVTN
jgi:multidrug efflux pump subunit AcrB